MTTNYRQTDDPSIDVQWTSDEVAVGLLDLFDFLSRHGVNLTKRDRMLLRPYGAAFAESGDGPEIQVYTAWSLVDQVNGYLKDHDSDLRLWRTDERSNTWLLLAPERAEALKDLGSPILSKAPPAHLGLLWPGIASAVSAVALIGVVVVTLWAAEAYTALAVVVALLVFFWMASRGVPQSKRSPTVTLLAFLPIAVATATLRLQEHNLSAIAVVAAAAVSTLANLWLRRAARVAAPHVDASEQ